MSPVQALVPHKCHLILIKQKSSSFSCHVLSQTENVHVQTQRYGTWHVHAV